MINSLPKLLITGANGQLGSMLRHHANKHPFHIIFCGRNDLDITDYDQTMAIIHKHKPDAVINAAAYTQVDKAEEDFQSALAVNHFGTANIARTCAALDIPLLHISTDYVFSGDQEVAYRESDTPNPINAYGRSKLLGEESVVQYCHKYIILRISGVYSEFNVNFYKTILRLAKERKELRIVNDQVVCPTYAGDIAETLFSIAKRLNAWGIYHYCSTPPITWHGFATLIIENNRHLESMMVEKIIPITSSEFGAKAKRPPFSNFDCAKINNDYGIIQPLWSKHLCLS